jgi:hypothetical protein
MFGLYFSSFEIDSDAINIMIRSINKVTNKGDGYVEMKEMGGQDELKKLVFGLKGLMSSMENLKN